MKKLLLTLTMSLLCVAACCATEINGINYILNSDGTAEVTSKYPSYSGSVVIPPSVTYNGITYKVIGINDWAFAGDTGLTSITIPNSVTNIGERAFEDCTKLASVTMGNGVTRIRALAFTDCSKLKTIILSAALERMDSYVFENCSSLETITVPQSVKQLGEYAFRGCNAKIFMLPTTPPELIKESGPYFYEQPAIGAGDYYVPCDAVSLYNAAAAWKTITVKGGTVAVVDKVAYRITCDNNALVIKNDNGYTGNLVIPSKVTHDGNAYSVTGIGDNAFHGCKSLTVVTTPNSVTNIGSCAFSESGLMNVYLGTGLKTIDCEAFYACNNLQGITCYSMRPPSVINSDGIAKAFDAVSYSMKVYVPADYLNIYKVHDVWGLYDVQPIGVVTAQTQDLQVTPHYTTVDVVWPSVSDAATYELTISSGGVTVFTLIFNAQGQLTSIAFHAPAAERQNAVASQQGFKFTVTGLDDGSSYSLTIDAKDAIGSVIKTFSKNFSTGYTALSEPEAARLHQTPRKVIENGRVVILLPDGRKYDINGRQVR